MSPTSTWSGCSIANVSEKKPVEPAPEDLLPTAAAPVSRKGDLWILGSHRLLCGDARSDSDYARLLEGETADLVLTDPPFNVRVDGNVSGLGKVRHEEFAMASGEMSEADFTSFLSTFLGNAKAHSRGGAILFVFMDWRHLFELTCAGREQGLALKNLIVWAKDNGGRFIVPGTSWCLSSRTATQPTPTPLSLASTAATAPMSGNMPE